MITGTTPQKTQKIAGPTAPLSALNLFTTFTRETAAAAGLTVPPPNPSLPAKYWADLSPDTEGSGSKVYQFVNPKTGQFYRQSLPKSFARTLNIPGASDYPEYTPAPTVAEAGGTPVDVYDLSTHDEATSMAKEVNAVDVEDLTPSWVQFGEETRRMWGVRVKLPGGGTDVIAVGQLLKEKYAHGVGAPVTVDLSGDRPKWAPSSATTTGADIISVPARDLYPGEEIDRDGSLMGAGTGDLIIRLVDTTAATSGVSGLTEAEHAAIMTTAELVAKLAEKAGV